MAEEEYDLVPYRDISDLKKELDSMRGRKEVSTSELHDAVQKLAQTMNDMLEVFGAAAEQMRLEEREHESDAKRHEVMISKLDKIIDQNKTIAEGMVAIVEMVKKKIAVQRDDGMARPAKESADLSSRPRAEPKQFPEPRPFLRQQGFQQRTEPMMQRPQPVMQPAAMGLPPLEPTSLTPQMPPPDFGSQMPPMEPAPMPELDFPEEPFPFEEEPKKKGLFGMFKK